MLETDSIAVILNEQKYKLPDIKELDKFLNANSAGITKEKFYIIYDITITTKKIIDIINIVKAAKIDNYKAVKLEGLFNLNEPK